ncbi:MAG: hypothetical protein KAH32_08835 [Chlamydiia bacterium]|nr:hypothetical protein [Chlamydiia bacterium]
MTFSQLHLQNLAKTLQSSSRAVFSSKKIFAIFTSGAFLTIMMTMYVLHRIVRNIRSIMSPNQSMKKQQVMKHASRMIHDIQDIIETKNIHNIHHPYGIREAIDTLKSFESISRKTLFNDKALKCCNNPTEELIYECMVMTELLMQESHGIQHKAIEESNTQSDTEHNFKLTDKDIKRDISSVSTAIKHTLNKNKKELIESLGKIRKSSYLALLIINNIYESQVKSNINTHPKYHEEFIRNLNIILHMVSEKGFNNLDEKSINSLKSQFSTYFSNEENVNFTKKDGAITELESRETFIKSFSKHHEADE